MDKKETAKLEPLAPRWYCVNNDGIAMLCKDEEDARANARHCDLAWPKGAPHRAVLLGDVAAERERCAKAAYAAIQSVHPAMRQSADVMINAVNRAIGYPTQPRSTGGA